MEAIIIQNVSIASLVGSFTFCPEKRLDGFIPKTVGYNQQPQQNHCISHAILDNRNSFHCEMKGLAWV